MFFERAPLVLCILLTRFNENGSKINNPITTSSKLNVCPYSKQATQMYTLVSVIEHFGSTRFTGHYAATCRSKWGEYYKFSDNKVHPISIEEAKNGYVLFYEKEHSSKGPQSTSIPFKPQSNQSEDLSTKQNSTCRKVKNYSIIFIFTCIASTI